MVNLEVVNKSYCGVVVELKDFVSLPNCDNVKGVLIFGNHIIVGKDQAAGDVGIYFPVETSLSKSFLGPNNLYRKAEFGNVDPEKTGFFEEHGRVKAMKFRGHKSVGFWIPLSSLTALGYSESEFSLGDEFNSINGVEICKKYVPRFTREPGAPRVKGAKKAKVEDLLVDGQFRFHFDTAQLRRNSFKVQPDTIVSVSDKWHGCVAFDTLVETLERGVMKIGEIVENELDVHVLGRDLTHNEDIFVPVAKGYKKEDDGEWFEITLEDGRVIEITGNNPVWLPRLKCYREVAQLCTDDLVLLREDISREEKETPKCMPEMRIVQINRIKRKTRYDLTVPGTQNFYANGMLIHNTSVICGNLLAKVEHSWFHRTLSKLFGVRLQEHTYAGTAASRRVIKSVASEAKPDSQHFYSTDIWSAVQEEIKDRIPKGYTVYGEIVGWTPEGGAIQAGYHYGCPQGTHQVLVYRVTVTNVEGKVAELSWKPMLEFCAQYGLEPVKELFYGKARDFVLNSHPLSKATTATLGSITLEDLVTPGRDGKEFGDLFIEALEHMYLEKPCKHNRNEVPAEGVVIRIDHLEEAESYKLKSFLFLKKESESLDKGEEDLEAQEESLSLMNDQQSE